jgi:ribokinase
LEPPEEVGRIAAQRALRRRGARTVVLTLGERGCLLVSAEGTRHVPAEKVKAVDTTGAGDAFVGSLAYFMGREPLEKAVELSVQIATRSVLKSGTQTSFPSRQELHDLLGE